MEQKLTPFQVGENDIVLAANSKEAEELLRAHSGCFEDSEELEVEDLSNRLDMKFSDEEGNFISTLGDWIKDMKEPQYIVGWE